MCGFAGEIRFDARPVDLAAVARMNERMADLRFEAEGHELALARNREMFVRSSVSFLQQALGLV